MQQRISLLQTVVDLYGLDEHEANGLIMSGRVLVNDKPITKVGTQISQAIIDKPNGIRIKNYDKYVSRGAYKLLGALQDFNVDVTDLICLDIGSSTGGFTDVLLQNGARHVYAVDCGSNQLDYRLRTDNRVSVYEQTSIQNMTAESFDSKIDLAVMDVSFTSCIGIISHVFTTGLASEMITLVKPQFEYSDLRNILNLSDDFHGIVTNEQDRKKIFDYVVESVKKIDSKIEIVGQTVSKIKGTKGNVEYLLYIKHK